MNFKKISLALLLGGAILAGCAKKPPPPPPSEPAPPKVEAPKPAPAPAAPKVVVDEAAVRRDLIKTRAAQVLMPIYFSYDQSSLGDEGKVAAEAIARFLQEFPEVKLSVEGHADERGTNEYNLALGERRAQSVQQYLASYGVDAGRVSVLSYGEEKPASEGKDESGWALNRRAEFTPSY